jgi:hypothetical protein
VVSHHIVDVEACRLGLRLLVRQSLFEGANPGVQDGAPGALLLVRRGLDRKALPIDKPETVPKPLFVMFALRPSLTWKFVISNGHRARPRI